MSNIKYVLRLFCVNIMFNCLQFSLFVIEIICIFYVNILSIVVYISKLPIIKMTQSLLSIGLIYLKKISRIA
jgi:hypothetical protein